MPPVPKQKRDRQRHFLKEWRKVRGLTQEQLAERLGTSRSNYGRIEKREVPYNQDILEAAAEALGGGLTAADLLDRNPLDDGEREAWRLLKEMKPEQRQRALRVLAALAEEAA